ncbi:unnamed protein product [Brachionus calyciflorus]|uniref:Uncharacterized protein n=1 Tax=Brachionus calyciflorus TaxID=104777 RepID=A0A814G337_9BILA|nr:unnamed protein product [Brachionus calyciflorus]
MVETYLEKNIPAIFSDQENLDEVLEHLYYKCAYPYDHLDPDEIIDPTNSFVICKDIIDYLINIIFENDPNNTVIKFLEKAFYEYFNLEGDFDETILSERSLDFLTFKEILGKWIQKIKNKEKTDIQHKEIKRKTSNSYLCSKKLQNLKYSVSCYENFSSLHRDNLKEDVKFSSLNPCTHNKLKLSNKSLSLSNGELNQTNDPDKDFNSKYLKIELNQMKHEMTELKSENFKLRDNIENLRTQLQLAEDTNSQLALDAEIQARKSSDFYKKNQELLNKISFHEKDIDDLRIQNDELKKKVEELTNENSNLNQKLDENLFLLGIKEKLLIETTNNLNETQSELDFLTQQMEEQKKLSTGLQLLNSKIEKKNIELELKVSHDDEMCQKFISLNKELKLENENLKEKCSSLESEIKFLNQKLFKKNFVDKNENKENLNAKQTHTLLVPPLKDKTNYSTPTNNKNAINPNDEIESESLINTHRIAIYNRNNFTLNDQPFWYEQFENSFLQNKDKSGKTELEYLVDVLQDFIYFLDSLKSQQDDRDDSNITELKLRDTNNNKKILELIKLNQSILLEKLFGYYLNGSNGETCTRDKLHSLVDQTRILINNFKLISNEFQRTILDKKNSNKAYQLTPYVNIEPNGQSWFKTNNLKIELQENNFNDLTLIKTKLEPSDFLLVSTPSEKTSIKSEYSPSKTRQDSKILESITLSSLDKSEKTKMSLKAKSTHTKQKSFTKSFSSVEIKKNFFEDNLSPTNLTNLPIKTDLINSGFSKSLFDSTDLNLSTRSNLNEKENLIIENRFINFFKANYSKVKILMYNDPIGFFRMTFSVCIFGFSVIFFLMILCRGDDISTFLSQLIYVISNLVEIKNPFDSLRAN